MAVELKEHNQNGLTAIRDVVAAVVDTNNDLTREPRGIVCTADGDITLRFESGALSDRTYTFTASSDVHPYSPTRIMAIGSGTFDLVY